MSKLTFLEVKDLIRKDYNVIKNQPYLEPYLDPILSLNSINDKYIMDEGRSICAYFLSNAGTWRTENAKIAKKELKELLKK
jgi:hypothetical protein